MSQTTGIDIELTKQSFFFSIGQYCQMTLLVTVLCCLGMVCMCLAIATEPIKG